MMSLPTIPRNIGARYQATVGLSDMNFAQIPILKMNVVRKMQKTVDLDRTKFQWNASNHLKINTNSNDRIMSKMQQRPRRNIPNRSINE